MSIFVVVSRCAVCVCMYMFLKSILISRTPEVSLVLLAHMYIIIVYLPAYMEVALEPFLLAHNRRLKCIHTTCTYMCIFTTKQFCIQISFTMCFSCY